MQHYTEIEHITNVYEGAFKLLEFGYMIDEGYLYREHELRNYTSPFKIVGTVDDSPHLLQAYPKDFNYTEDLKQYYE